MYIYKNYELEHYEIEYMNMQYEIIWICEYEIIQCTYNYEYTHIYKYMKNTIYDYMHIKCI